MLIIPLLFLILITQCDSSLYSNSTTKNGETITDYYDTTSHHIKTTYTYVERQDYRKTVFYHLSTGEISHTEIESNDKTSITYPETYDQIIRTETIKKSQEGKEIRLKNLNSNTLTIIYYRPNPNNRTVEMVLSHYDIYDLHHKTRRIAQFFYTRNGDVEHRSIATLWSTNYVAEVNYTTNRLSRRYTDSIGQAICRKYTAFYNISNGNPLLYETQSTIEGNCEAESKMTTQVVKYIENSAQSIETFEYDYFHRILIKRYSEAEYMNGCKYIKTETYDLACVTPQLITTTLIRTTKDCDDSMGDKIMITAVDNEGFYTKKYYQVKPDMADVLIRTERIELSDEEYANRIHTDITCGIYLPAESNNVCNLLSSGRCQERE